MEYTTIQKTADRWGVSRAYVHKLCQDGRIPGAVYENKHWRIPVDAEKPKAGTPGFLSASAIARKWGVEVNKVTWMCQECVIPGVKRDDKIWLIPQDTVNPLEGYALVSKMAERWGMHRVIVSRACTEGRIPGAKQVGRNWYIPTDATKPTNEKTDRLPGYTSPTKTAEKWGIARQNVCKACREGLVPGAELINGRWHIPEDAARPLKATKPADERMGRESSYIFASQAAEKWGTTRKVVNRAAKDGRIPGAKQVGQTWYIPVDATKPVDEHEERK